MTTDKSRNDDGSKGRLPAVARFLVYSVTFVGYAAVLVFAIVTVGLIEIRQANLQDSNALIAMLEQKDRYGGNYFERTLSQLVAETDRYDDTLRRTFSRCPAQPAVGSKSQITGVADPRPLAPIADDVGPQTCEAMKTLANQHLADLLRLQDDLQLRQANLPTYYDAYFDGLRNKSPQLVPLLRFIDSPEPAMTDWARLPLELQEMLLLILMGALGGVISVTRCFVDAATPNPAVRELTYRPVAGAVIALGIYVLFRAAQLFFGGAGQDATTVSTSVFVLAALGLASGFSAREAIAQIERMTARLLRHAADDRDQSGGSANGPAPAAR